MNLDILCIVGMHVQVGSFVGAVLVFLFPAILMYKLYWRDPTMLRSKRMLISATFIFGAIALVTTSGEQLVEVL